MVPLRTLLNPLPVPFTPPNIKTQIGVLIQAYCRQRSAALALAVTYHLEALCAHPDYVITESDRCDYRRLARHWRCLAWLDNELTCSSKDAVRFQQQPGSPRESRDTTS